MLKKGRKIKKSRRRIAISIGQIPFLFLIVLSLFILWYASFPLFIPQMKPVVLFTNDPGNNHTRYYRLGDIYSSLLNKARSISMNGIVDDVVFHGSRNKKEVALTFDADMTPFMKKQYEDKVVKSYYDATLTSLLENTNTKATLFLTGMWAEIYPKQTQELASNPLFEIGNHSYSHPAFDGYCYGLPRIPDYEKVAEIGYSQMLLSRLAQKDINLFRFPGGCYGKSDVLLVDRAGERVVQWDVVADDGFNTNPTSIVQNVLTNTKNGSIIVMHMNGYPNDPVTSSAVSVIIPELKKNGFTFVTVSELMDDSKN